MKIVFIQTGGTIDKTYPKKIKSYAFEIAEPAVERILKSIKPGFRFQIIPLLKKDSMDIKAKERKLIAEVCKKTTTDKIIITHGTDTMIETARKLSKIKGKTIVLTGSLLPERFIDSDAMFNIGTAVGAMDFLQEGVYIAMSGRVFPWHKCQKSQKTARFIAN